jgi:hypothetical protein
MQGVIPTTDSSSLASFFDNVFIPGLSVFKVNMAVVVQRLECTVVVRKTGVQLSPSAFAKGVNE